MAASPRDIVKQRAEALKPGGADVRTPADAGGEWVAPIPLSAATTPPPAFPLDVFPDNTAAFLRSVADGVNAPVDYAASFALGVLAGAIGASMRLDLTPSWYERACLYICVVAPKSSGKTPSFLAITNPLRKIQAKIIQRHADLNLDEAKNPAQVIYATDTTVEAIAPRLKASPRGMVITCDELSGWVGGFNQYKAGKGSDRQFWLSNWSGGDVSVLRRNPDSPHVYVPHPCVSVVGGVQPPVLAELARGRDDGLLERLLVSAPLPKPKAAPIREGYPLAKHWEDAIESLVNREMLDGDFGPKSKKPMRLSVSADAWEVFRSWVGETVEDERMAGAKSKLDAYAARFALVLHAIIHLPGQGTDFPREVHAETMESGVRLARYFLAHATFVYGTHRQSPAIGDAQVVLDWIVRNAPRLKEKAKASRLPAGTLAFQRRDVFQSLSRRFEDSDALAKPLKLLVDHGFIRWVTGGESWTFRVNPLTPGVAENVGAVGAENDQRQQAKPRSGKGLG